jgi:nitroreductase
MDVVSVIRTRRSIRKYKSKQIEKDKIERILEAGRLSPSAANIQPWHFIIVTDSELRSKLREAYSSDWFVNAPAILIVCANPNEAWCRSDGEEYWKVDAAIAMQSMILQAWEEGLGTCWIAAFKESPVKKILSIPENIRVVAMTPIGYPDQEKGEVVNRKLRSEIAHFDGW